jgi:ABC-type dipeptide/oligopeptide/nickel transport system permease component
MVPWWYVGRRVAHTALILIGITLVVFWVIRLSGDPVLLMLPADASQQDIERLRQSLGFDQPVHVQLWRFMERVATGDFGKSLRFQEPALPLVLDRLPNTVLLALTALSISTLVAIPLGVLSAVRRNSSWDHAAMFVALLGQSMPIFWTGIMLITVFSVALDLFPSSGSGTLRHLVLPAVALGFFSTGRVTRLVRGGMLEVLGQDYVRTARAKGLAERGVVYRHALRNCLLPVITIVGLELGSTLGGAVVTEMVFAWPGVGRLIVSAIFARDYPLVQAAVFVVAAMFVLVNLAVDLLYAVVDPRVRYA